MDEWTDGWLDGDGWWMDICIDREREKRMVDGWVER